MLAIVPWVASRPDGAAIDELCDRFDLDRTQLVNDLATVSMVGVAPYTPDLMVEVVVEDDRVWVNLPIAFDKPLRLTPDEGFALLVAGSSLLSVPGADETGPLARALEKIASLLGVRPGDNVQIALGHAEDRTLSLLRDSIAAQRQVRLDYYSYGRDEHAVRVVEPDRLWAAGGQWYVAGYCHLAAAERIFRVDRVVGAVLLDSRFSGPGRSGRPERADGFDPGDEAPRIVLELAPNARWVLDQYPIEAAEELPDGRARVRLAVTAIAWLERLLLRLGPDARIVETDERVARVGSDAAKRILAVYRRPP
ncbi:MAG: WYL domain-containing protein [Actinobacteria bacterium]|nr:WYL domain-containing protein [Actinomycetota bacterium]